MSPVQLPATCLQNTAVVPHEVSIHLYSHKQWPSLRDVGLHLVHCRCLHIPLPMPLRHNVSRPSTRCTPGESLARRRRLIEMLQRIPRSTLILMFTLLVDPLVRFEGLRHLTDPASVAPTLPRVAAHDLLDRNLEAILMSSQRILRSAAAQCIHRCRSTRECPARPTTALAPHDLHTIVRVALGKLSLQVKRFRKILHVHPHVQCKSVVDVLVPLRKRPVTK
mmetsp:Transcript_98248/g.262509  ORF Transcript_98248/g.262509 Transcript_98248/m.262509 type:complete len:222 (-) Transcript_98248:928-1593(-)